MNNWDNRSKLTVVIGEDGVPNRYLYDYAYELSTDTGKLVERSLDDTPAYVLGSTVLSEGILDMVLSCLSDQLANVDVEDWLVDINDTYDVSEDDEELMYLNIKKGIYYGPGVDIEVRYLYM